MRQCARPTRGSQGPSSHRHESALRRARPATLGGNGFTVSEQGDFFRQRPRALGTLCGYEELCSGAVSTTFMPFGDLATQPQARPPSPAVQHGARHVGIPPLVEVNRRRVGQTQYLRHVMGVNQVIDVDQAAHALSLRDPTPPLNHAPH